MAPSPRAPHTLKAMKNGAMQTRRSGLVAPVGGGSKSILNSAKNQQEKKSCRFVQTLTMITRNRKNGLTHAGQLLSAVYAKGIVTDGNKNGRRPMLNPIKHRTLNWWYAWGPFLILCGLLAASTAIGFGLGYCVGCHVGYVRTCDDGPSAPVKYFEVKK